MRVSEPQRYNWKRERKRKRKEDVSAKDGVGCNGWGPS